MGGEKASGGKASGGAASGGRPATGGSDDGGEQAGGNASGGSSSGGTGAASSGGRATGGARATGGSAGAAGGAPSGGKNAGGSPAGGKFTGGAGGATNGGVASCTDTDGADARVRGTSTGIDGAFTDACEGGDLREYSCERIQVMPCLTPAAASSDSANRAAPIVPVCNVVTGNVTSSLVACGGKCKDGTCLYWCPNYGDTLEYLESGSDEIVIENQTNGFVYACEVSFENDFDCDAESLAGEKASVYSLGNCNVEQVVFGTATAEAPSVQRCTYTCSLLD